MTIGIIETPQGLNILKMLDDHLDPEIEDIKEQITTLESKITEKQSQLIILMSIRRRLTSGVHINKEGSS